MLSSFLFAATLLQNSTLSDTPQIEDIQVTATRTPIALDKTSSTVTIFTDEDLQSGQYLTVADVLKTIPGLAVAKTASVGGQVQVRLRGAEANQILVIIDGIEMNDPAAGDEVQWEFLSVQSIERIEIIRSPMSSVWGSDALAGVIAITTKSGAKPHASLTAELGSFNSRQLTAQFGTRLDAVTLAGGITFSESDGVNVSNTGRERDGARSVVANLKTQIALGDAGDTGKITLSFRHNNSRTDFDSTDFSTGLPADSDGENTSQKTYLSAGIDYKILDKWEIAARITRLETELDVTTGAKTGLYLDHRLTLTEGHRITLALDWENTDFSQTGTALIYGDPNQQQTMDATGLLADYVGDITNAITVSGSLRRDWNSDFKDFTSWRLGVSAKVSDQLRLFASGSKGQKAPTFIERFGYFPDQFLGNPDLKPEQSLSFEAGLEAHISATASITISAFTTTLENEINGFAFDPATFLFTAVNKDEDSKRAGLDIIAKWAPLDPLTIEAGYSYLDATEENASGEQVDELRRPAHSASLTLNWQDGGPLSLSLTSIYTGQATDLFYPPWPNPSERVTLKDYLLVRLAAQYKLDDHLSLYTRLENGLNEDYEDVYGFNTPGRAVYAGLKLSL